MRSAATYCSSRRLALPNCNAIGANIMAAAKELAGFTVVRKGEDYRITIEDANGDTVDYSADFDALDVISEAIDEALDSDEEEALGVDEDEEEEQ
jgi:hypothetical protein